MQDCHLPNDIYREIENLEAHRAEVNEAYLNSSWAVGDRYRAKLREIDDSLRSLKAAAPETA